MTPQDYEDIRILKHAVVMGWNMGGHNYLRRGATSQARGLDWLFRKYVKQERTK